MSADALNIPITFSGGDAAAAEIRKPTQALGSLSVEATKANDASGKLKGALGGLAESSAKMTSIFATLDQGTGVLTGTFGKAANAAAGLLGAIGAGGAMGVAGGLVAAVGILSSAFSALNAETDRARAKLDELTKAAANSEIALARAAEASMTPAERLRTRKAAAAAAEESAYQAEQDVAAAQIARDRQRFEAILSTQGTAAQRGEGGRGRRDDFNAFISSTAARANFGLGTEGDPQEWEGAYSGAWTPEGQKFGRSGGGSKGGPQALTGFDTSKAAKAMASDADMVRDAWTDAGAAISNTMAGVVTDMITGSDMSAKAIVKGLGDQLVGMGVRDVFEGTSRAIASYGADPAATGLIAVGAAEIAAGVGMGAASTGLPGVGGGGGWVAARPGSGGTGWQDAPRSSGPTVINMYSLNPTAETGRSISNSLRANDRKNNRR